MQTKNTPLPVEEIPVPAPDQEADALPAEGEPVMTVEIPVPEVHPFMTTNFADYSVTEGLFLVVCLILLANSLANFFRRWF